MEFEDYMDLVSALTEADLNGCEYTRNIGGVVQEGISCVGVASIHLAVLCTSDEHFKLNFHVVDVGINTIEVR